MCFLIAATMGRIEIVFLYIILLFIYIYIYISAYTEIDSSKYCNLSTNLISNSVKNFRNLSDPRNTKLKYKKFEQ